MNTDIENPLPCPFCGCPGDKLLQNRWSLEDEEVNAYECPECFAGAPVASWRQRANTDKVGATGDGQSIRINLIDDRQGIGDYIQSPAGEQTIMKTMHRNKES